MQPSDTCEPPGCNPTPPSPSPRLTQHHEGHLAHVHAGRLLDFTLVGGAVGGRQQRDGERGVAAGRVAGRKVQSSVESVAGVDVFDAAAVGQELRESRERKGSRSQRMTLNAEVTPHSMLGNDCGVDCNLGIL